AFRGFSVVCGCAEGSSSTRSYSTLVHQENQTYTRRVHTVPATSLLLLWCGAANTWGRCHARARSQSVFPRLCLALSGFGLVGVGANVFACSLMQLGFDVNNFRVALHGGRYDIHKAQAMDDILLTVRKKV